MYLKRWSGFLWIRRYVGAVLREMKKHAILLKKKYFISSFFSISFQARIKKIMQTDEDVGKVAQPVPVIISRALELFVENLLKKANDITSQRGARTLTPSHL